VLGANIIYLKMKSLFAGSGGK